MINYVVMKSGRAIQCVSLIYPRMDSDLNRLMIDIELKGRVQIRNATCRIHPWLCGVHKKTESCVTALYDMNCDFMQDNQNEAEEVGGQVMRAHRIQPYCFWCLTGASSQLFGMLILKSKVVRGRRVNDRKKINT